MKRIILSSALLLLFASCSKNVDNSKPVIDLTHPYTQWQEVKGFSEGLIDITNAKILTIMDDSTYHYNSQNFRALYTRAIDSIGFLKSNDRNLSFISHDKKDTITFYFTLQNDTLRLGFGPSYTIQMEGDMTYKKVH